MKFTNLSDNVLQLSDTELKEDLSYLWVSLP